MVLLGTSHFAVRSMNWPLTASDVLRSSRSSRTNRAVDWPAVVERTLEEFGVLTLQVS